MKNTEKAFHWIIDILERERIPFRISGGFAARTYGTTRELADIDIEVVKEDISKIAAEAKPYIIFGPAHYKDENWDLELMTLKFEDQEIDIADVGVMIFNKKTQQWENCSSGLGDIEMKEVYGKNVPVESLDSLIEYKIKLSREVDIEDVEQLTKIRREKDSN